MSRNKDSGVEILPGISKGRVNQYRSLRGTWRYFGFHTRAEFDAARISDEQVARYIETQSSKRDFIENEKKDLPKVPVPSRVRARRELKLLQDEWNERTEAYLRHFDAPTPNDVAALKRLAAMDMRVDRIQQQRLALMERTDVDSVRTVKLLGEDEVQLSGEIRQLQKVLGIDRVQRREEEETQDPLRVYRDGLKDAAWLMQNEVHEVAHRCADGKVIPIMLIWHWFPTEPHGDFTQQCPNCGEVFTVTYKKRGIARSMKNFEIPDLAQLLSTAGGESLGER